MKFNYTSIFKQIQSYGTKKERKRPNKKQLIIISIIIMIIITFLSGISFGKAIHNTNIRNNTKIAKPILEIDKESEIIITEDNKTGEYNFKVKNYNKEEISEVDMVYYIEILENKLSEHIKYQLYDNDTVLELVENKTEKMFFYKDVKAEKNYTLKVNYDNEKNINEDIMEYIQIKVHTEQLKM